MTEFFASLYEFFGLLPFYSKDFADHLRGWAADCSGYTGTIWYNIIAITMTGVTALGYALMYHIIDSPKWNKKQHWWIVALVIIALNWFINARGFLQNAKIGALTVCPYFNIQADEQSPIQRSHFIAKTRAALYYYKDNITGNNSVNALYYIGDDYIGEAYPNDPGDRGQKNKAHFIELASALAIIDFLEIPDERLQCVNGKAQSPIYKQFAVKNDVQEITFAELYDGTKDKIERRLSQLTFLYRYVTENLKQAIGQQAWCQDKPTIDQTFLNTPFYRTYLSDFLKAYKEWLTELSENRRAFSPFNLDSNLETLIKGRPVQGGIFEGRVDYNRFDDYLNRTSRGQQYPSAEKKFVKLFFDATNELLTDRFGFQKQ